MSKKMGRPRLHDEPLKTVGVAVRPSTKEWLRSASSDLGKNISSVVREAIESYRKSNPEALKWLVDEAERRECSISDIVAQIINNTYEVATGRDAA